MSNKILRFFKNPRPVILRYLHKHAARFSDVAFVKLKFYLVTGHRLNLKNPKGFCEKIQWLKIYDRKLEYTTMVDKYAAKELVRKTIGEQYVIPTLGVWQTPEEIEWNTLPQQFVLKTNHAGGSLGVVICKDKNNFDKDAAIKKLNESLALDSYSIIREWPYKNIKRIVFAEKYIEDETGDLTDYKVMCFGGVPKLIQVHLGRSGVHHTQDFYDVSWNKLSDLNQVGCELSDIVTPKPVCLDEMLELSSKMSQGFAQLRVDWYIVNGQLYFGEYTFYDASGLDEFIPKSMELEIGSWITLPKMKNYGNR